MTIKRLVDYTPEQITARENAQDAVRALSHACELQTDLYYLAPGDKGYGSYEHQAVNVLMQRAYDLVEALKKNDFEGK